MAEIPEPYLEVLRDPSIVLPGDYEVMQLIGRWALKDGGCAEDGYAHVHTPGPSPVCEIRDCMCVFAHRHTSQEEG